MVDERYGVHLANMPWEFKSGSEPPETQANMKMMH